MKVKNLNFVIGLGKSGFWAAKYLNSIKKRVIVVESNNSKDHFLYKRKLEELIPSDSYYEHDDWDLRTENMQEDENVNGRSHVRGSIIGSTSVSLPVVDSEIILGRWQRLFFVELDCARPRRLFIQIQDLD